MEDIKSILEKLNNHRKVDKEFKEELENMRIHMSMENKNL